MTDRLHILCELARHYERTQAGRKGVGERDLLLDYEEFLRQTGCGDGEARHIAERNLADAAREGVLLLVPHRRDPKLIQQIRFSREREQDLFTRIGKPSPTQRRCTLARQFANAASLNVPEEWRDAWAAFCARFDHAAKCGESVAPFERDSLELNHELLALTAKLLAWRSESLLRFASCVLCDNSKRLETLSSRLGQILEQLTNGQLRSLEDVGLLANPRFVLLHGPLKICADGQWLDFGLLDGPFRLSEIDIAQVREIQIPSRRCLTVENETTFHELAKLRSGELLIQTTFPGSATLALLRRLPTSIEFWHFGDTDVEGFEILRDLRERSGRPFRALHMRYTELSDSPAIASDERRKIERLLKSETMCNEWPELQAMLVAGRKGRFEQESLGLPRSTWPFYGERCNVSADSE
jgi:hypothetical protein